MQKFLRMVMIMSFAAACFQAHAQEEYFKIDSTETKPPRTEKTVEKKEKPAPSEDFGDLKFIDKLRLGGSFGLSFGSYTNINLSPMAGVNLTENFLLGGGLTYMYIRSKYFIPNPSASYYGARAFAMYSVLPMLNLQAEFEGMNVKYYNYKTGGYSRTWLGSPLVGAAYTQPVGGRFIKGVHLTVLYNLNYNNQLNPTVNSLNQPENISPYSSPFVFRVTLL